MEPIITESKALLLIGIKVSTNLSESKTGDLWSTFFHRVAEVSNRKNKNYISVQVYPSGQNMDSFTPITNFEKWAAIEVNEIVDIPEGMESLIIEAGKYAIFKHKGIAADFIRTSQHIFSTWLPSSGMELDDRPHFEILGEDYKGPNDPNSEEDVYIPIK